MTEWNPSGDGGQERSAQSPPWAGQPPYGPQPSYPAPGYGAPNYPAYGAGPGAPSGYGQPGAGYGPYGPPGGNGMGPIGQIRGTGMTIFLVVITLGIYSWYWWYQVHAEMKRHSGQGLDGPIALVLAIFVSIIMPFLTSDEVANLYERQGRQTPVGAATGLWYFPGILILVGPIIWFVKTNGALNEYWRSMGAQG